MILGEIMQIDAIQLDRNSHEKLYMQIARQLSDMIDEGKISQNSRLLPVRKLAKQLDCNSVTVVNAYKQLEKDGKVYSKVGSGYYVSGKPTEENDLIQNSSYYADMDDFRFMSQGQLIIEKGQINFASASPSSDLFPADEFKNSLCSVLDRDKGEAFTYQESNGYKPLRESISDYMLKKYSVKASSKSLQIISGAQQGIDIIAKAMLESGDFVAVENPTYPGACAVFRSRQANIIPVPINRDGIDIDELENVCRIYSPKLIYVMPYCQNPTTYNYTDGKKERLIDIAFKYNCYIVEDDSSGGIRDDGYLPVKYFDSCDRVIYLKSFSKSFMPGLRIGFLISPKALYNNIMQAKHTTDITSSGFIQRAFDDYMRSGEFDRHISRVRKLIDTKSQKTEKLLEELKQSGVKINGDSINQSYWLTLDGVNDMELYNLCRVNGLVIAPGRMFYLGEAAYNKIRISLCGANGSEIERGIGILKRCIDELKTTDSGTIMPMI